jgi:predicted dehydrogenase
MKVAVLSSGHERTQTYTRRLRALPDVEPLLADPAGGWDEVFAQRPDAVIITADTGRRRALVERAAAAGAHVLCEHPLAGDESDAEAIVRACADAGVRLSLASPACYGPAFAAVRKQLADGEVLGAVTTVHGAYNGPRPAQGGALDTHAPALLDMVDLLLGGTPAEQVYAQTNSVLSADPGIESAALVTVRYADGTVVSLDCSWGVDGDASATAGPALSVIGGKASVEFTAWPRLLGGYDAAAAREHWVTRGDDPYAVLLGAFLAAVRDGQPAGPDGATGLRTLRIVRAARESARTGQPVEVP